MKTSSISGNISTKYYGHKYDADLVDTNIQIKVDIYFPDKVRKSNGTTLHISLNKNTMKQFQDASIDEMRIDLEPINAFTDFVSRNITFPIGLRYYDIVLIRKMSKEDLSVLKEDVMPGFRLTWSYSDSLSQLLYQWRKWVKTNLNSKQLLSAKV